jgi:hypothetical protein
MEANKRNELLEFLIELREDKAELEKKLKGVNGEIESVEEGLIADMLRTRTRASTIRESLAALSSANLSRRKQSVKASYGLR